MARRIQKDYKHAIGWLHNKACRLEHAYSTSTVMTAADRKLCDEMRSSIRHAITLLNHAQDALTEARDARAAKRFDKLWAEVAKEKEAAANASSKGVMVRSRGRRRDGAEADPSPA